MHHCRHRGAKNSKGVNQDKRQAEERKKKEGTGQEGKEKGSEEKREKREAEGVKPKKMERKI